MNTWLIRLAWLGCGVMLVMPPAWCCYVWQPPAAPELKPQPVASCCHKKQEQAPRPAPCCPAPRTHCPWCDREMAASSPKKVIDTPALPAPLVLAVLDAPRAGPAVAVATTLPAPSRPRHLLQCLWLC